MKLLGCAAAIALASIAGSALAETPLERGTYLMKSIAACGNCHTPLTPQGQPVEGMELAGRVVEERAEYIAIAPNITPDPETGIGNWTDQQIITAIREGKHPDGHTLGPPMPFGLYRGLSDTDVKAIVAYLRQVPAVKNAQPRSTYHIPLPPAYGPPVGQVAEVAPGVTAEYGAYLAGPVGHCIECHSPAGPQGAPDLANQLAAGGFEFHGPWGVSVSVNLTPHPQDGIAQRSDGDLVKMITTGVRPDGKPMLPPMPYGYYANISADDLTAIIAYLRQLPPLPFGG